MEYTGEVLGLVKGVEEIQQCLQVHAKQAERFGYVEGQYTTYYNFLQPVLAELSNPLYISYISSNRKEIILKQVNPTTVLFYSDLDPIIQNNNYFYLNFGNNKIYPIVNFKIEPKYDLTDIIRDSVPQSYINQYPNLPEDKILQKYAYEGAEGNLIRVSDFQGTFGQFYVMQNNLKRSFQWNDTLLFEFAKYFESSRFDKTGKEIRKAYPYLRDAGNGIAIPNLLDLTQTDVDSIPTGPDITLQDLTGTEDYINVIFKLYKPLDPEFTEKTAVYISYEYREPYADSVYLIDKSDPIQYNQLRPANFNVDAYAKQSIPTEYKNWNELLDANLPTSQKIIDDMFSGSLQGVPLNINYAEFKNFVHYSSAVERVQNFKYKLDLIEYY